MLRGRKRSVRHGVCAALAGIDARGGRLGCQGTDDRKLKIESHLLDLHMTGHLQNPGTDSVYVHKLQALEETKQRIDEKKWK